MGLYQLTLKRPHGALREYMSIHINAYRRIRVYT